MKENRQGCLSRSIRADALKSAKGMCSPGTKKERPRPKTHKPAPTQGEGCVKGGPSEGPPFAFNQGTDRPFAKRYALPAIFRTNKKHPGRGAFYWYE